MECKQIGFLRGVLEKVSGFELLIQEVVPVIATAACTSYKFTKCLMFVGKNLFGYTWSVQKVSRILNFRGLRI